jgi:hypothetical protein
MQMLEGMGVEMDYRMDRSVVETTSWFDASAGMVVRSESSGPRHMSIELNGIPDAGDFDMDIDMTMLLAMQLEE